MGRDGERGRGMGPRMREDTGRGKEYPAARFLEGLGMTFGVRWGNGRFANRPYGEREGRGLRMHGKTDVGAGRATTRVAPTGDGRGEGRRRDGSPHARGHGRGRGMHPHPNLPP